MGNGLQGVLGDLYSHSRPGVPRVLVVLTDGKSKDDVTGPAKALHDMDVRVMAVGVGPYLDVKQLHAVASDPKEEHVFTAGSFSSLEKVIKKVEKEICKGNCETFLRVNVCMYGLFLPATGLNFDVCIISTRVKRHLSFRNYSTLSEVPQDHQN